MSKPGDRPAQITEPTVDAEAAAAAELAELPDTLTVRGTTIRYLPPRDPCMVWEVLDLLAESPFRANLAALGACWPAMLKKVGYRADPISFAARVAVVLDEQGWAYADVRHAGQLAVLHMLERQRTTEKQVEAAVDFSGAQAGECGER